MPSPPGGLQIRAKCGDDKCDMYNGENKCNCPEDCTGEETPCIDYFQDISDEKKESCCGKFKAIKIALYQKNRSIVPNSAPAVIKCMNCGDGRCDRGAYSENKCNCPEDCEERAPNLLKLECKRSGGKVVNITECNGQVNKGCALPNGETCYIETVKNGKCPAYFGPKVLCDKQ